MPADVRLTEANRKVAAAFARHKRGDLRHAHAAYLGVLEQFPEHATALHYLGLIAQQSGQSQQAALLIERSIRIDPTDARAYNHLGQVYLALEQPQTAKECFEKALDVDPLHADSINNLANIVRSRDPLQAIELYRRALACAPQSANAAYNLANALTDEHDHHGACALLRQAIATDPTHYQAHHRLGVLLEQQGDFDSAIRHYGTAFEIQPRHAKSLARLLAVPIYRPGSAQVARAEACLSSASLGDRSRMRMHYGLGKHYERTGGYDSAFHHFSSAKRLSRESSARFDADKLAAQFDALIQVFDEKWFASAPAGHESDRPIFIVGMPRSGTTLTEQILASHPKVFGAGELPDMPRILKGLRPGYPRNVASLGDERLGQIAQEYLTALEAQAPRDVLRVTDKLPTNFIQLGMIATLFPKARIVHCRRDPLDVAVSSFSELFSLDSDYTTDLGDFAAYFLQYERLMAHWQRTLPTRIYELRYETLVSDPQASVRGLLEYCSLPWDAACLDFGTTPRVVKTPSRWQVRQPIHRSSIGRWRHYADHFEGLRRDLLNRGYRHETWGAA